MDRRDAAANRRPWYKDLDEGRMCATITHEDDDGDEHEVEVPIRFEVCGTCDGRGQHVNPGVDAHGITESEMYELGPDFERDYFSGVYDVTCYDCKGKRVVPVVDDRRLTLEQAVAWARVQDIIADLAEMDREMASERAFGC